MAETIRKAKLTSGDEDLRRDVSMLGRMLGEILVEQGGAKLFARVEAARRAAIKRRENRGPLSELDAALDGLDPETARDVVRAFSAYFSLTNLAEQVHRIRKRRNYLTTSDRPQPASLRAVIAHLADAGLDLEQVLATFDSIVVSPIFTAHPTQATRRTILAKEQRIAGLLIDRVEHPIRTPMEDQELDEQMRTEATLIWQTEEQPALRPAVSDEVESVLFVLTDVIYQTVPAFHDALRDAIEARWGEGTARNLKGPEIRFGSWVGGDMDGNPNVNAGTVRSTLERHRELVISRYRAEVRGLFDHLSQSISRATFTDAVMNQIEKYRQTMPELSSRIPSRYEDMPYRVLLWQIWERLGATEDDLEHAYFHVQDFIADLELITTSLAVNTGTGAGLELVERLLLRVRTFGFHLATLDLRQDAVAHRQACAELLGDPEFCDRTPAERSRQLARFLSSQTEPHANTQDALHQTLDVFRAVTECQKRFGADAIGPMIISMAQGPDDVLAVLALARAAGSGGGDDRTALDIAPLFETVDDIENASATLQAMLADPLYRAHLSSRENRQIVMLGYSDSSKISGIAASRWALYRAQEQLVTVCEDAEVGLTLFHGRGGTVGRGGSKPRDGVLATPCGAVRGRLRVTEQGEIITNKYGLRSLAERTLEVTVGAVAEATALCELTNAPEPAWRQTMTTVAGAGRSAYDRLVHQDSDFVQYFRTATPIDVIERLGLGSRPASRRSGGGVENLRAIPWVFSWVQNRHLLPGWYGVGAGLEEALDVHGNEVLRAMAERWKFFSTLLGDVSMVLAKADMDIAAAYAELGGEIGERLFPGIRAAFNRTRDIVLDLRGERELLDHEQTLQNSIRLRNPYVDPMSLLQIDLLRRWRAGGRKNPELELALFETVRGIARGLRNTG